MDSFGEMLREARESKELSYDKIAREISIDVKYLQGLENEDTAVFPGEPYLIGFLKNYADYLELDSDLLLKLYHNKILQESPVPDGLIQKHKQIPVLIIVLCSIFFAAAAAFVIIYFTVLRKPVLDENVEILSQQKRFQKYVLSDLKFINRVFEGDQLLIDTEDGQIVLTVKDTLESFGLDTPSGVFYTDLSEENEFDIDGDGSSDLIVYVSDISSTDKTRGAEVSVLLRHGVSVAPGSASISDDIPFAKDVQSKHPQIVIHEDNRAYPFTLNATFRASCILRDKVDRNDPVEVYYANGEQFSHTAQNGIRLWVSNINAVQFTVIADGKSFKLDIGKAGQVLVEDIKWIKDIDGKYKLVVIELD